MTDAPRASGNGATVDALLRVGQRNAVDSLSPSDLITRHLENAHKQLDTAREQLRQARRRVVQLEEAVTNWDQLRQEALSREQAVRFSAARAPRRPPAPDH